MDQDAGGRGRAGERALDPGGGDAGFAVAEYRFGLSDAGRAMEDEPNADALWGARVGSQGWYG